MAGYSVRYYGSKYGTLICRPYTLTQANTYVKEVSFYICDLSLDYDPNGYYGTGVFAPKAPRSHIEGMQWTSLPSTGLTEGHKSTDGYITVEGAPKASYTSGDYPRPELSWYKKVTLHFDPISDLPAGTTVYLGLYVPYTSEYATSRFGMAYIDNVVGYHNELNAIVKSDGSRAPYFDNIIVASAYTAPKYSITNVTSIGILDNTDYTIKYSITDGTAEKIDWVKAVIYSSDESTELFTTTIADDISQSSNLSGEFKLPSDKCKDGTEYKVSIKFSDGVREYETNKVSIYTYRTPKLNNVKLSNANFSSTGNSILYWDTNGRRWTTELESSFKTYLYIDAEGTWFEASNHNPVDPDSSSNLTTISQNLDKTFISTHFTKAQLSQDIISTNIRVRRKNESSGVYIDVTVPITIQNKPKYKVANATYYDNATNAQITPGSTVYIQKVPKVRIEWTYPSDADGGNISGYRLKIYKDSNINGTPYKTFDISSTSLSASKVVDIATDLNRGTINYITIEAYYIKPSNNEKVYGPIFSKQFIKPLSIIEKPIISYPVNETTWHNHNFRILFKLPKDGDYDTYDTTIKNSYSYNQIQVSINDKIYTFTNDNAMFSTNSLKHNINICLNPSILSNFVTSNAYKIKVRVQRKYYEQDWSDWSDEVLLRISAIKETPVEVGQIIEATHYNEVRNYSYRLWQVYPISALPSNNIVAIAKETKILQSHYVDIYKTIKNIQDDVNKWAVYDSNRQEIKFNQNISELSEPNQPTSEYVTAVADNRPNPEGRNYMRILVSSMNKLF